MASGGILRLMVQGLVWGLLGDVSTVKGVLYRLGCIWENILPTSPLYLQEIEGTETK